MIPGERGEVSKDPETGIKSISEWGAECSRGLQHKNLGTEVQGQAASRKITHSRKHRGLASDNVQPAKLAG